MDGSKSVNHRLPFVLIASCPISVVKKVGGWIFQALIVFVAEGKSFEIDN